MTMPDPQSFVGKYQILRCVSEGYVSFVYEARAPGETTSVAIKILREFWSPETEMAQRFANEQNALQSLYHPNLIRLLHTGHLPSGQPYMVLDWYPFDLGKVLHNRQKGLSTSIAAHIGAQIARGLLHLHEKGTVHRDVKPGNILLNSDKLENAKVCLSDLGLSKVNRELRSAVGMNISTAGTKQFGTLDYMAPEQWVKSKTVNGAADVYSLGVLLFQCISATLPFVADDAKGLMAMHLFKKPPMKRLGGDVSPALRELVERMLAKTPAERPAISEVLKKLETIAKVKG